MLKAKIWFSSTIYFNDKWGKTAVKKSSGFTLQHCIDYQEWRSCQGKEQLCQALFLSAKIKKQTDSKVNFERTLKNLQNINEYFCIYEPEIFTPAIICKPRTKKLFPTFLIYRSGKFIIFSGSLSLKHILRYFLTLSKALVLDKTK